MTPALDIADACVALRGQSVLTNVSLAVGPGEIVGVLGPNGGGKTTLLRAALGLVPLSGGSARLAGRPVRGLSERVRSELAAYLPQDRRVSWNLPAWRVVAMGRPAMDPRAVRPDATASLAQVGMAALAERGVLDMSGGERARVLLARLMLTGAPLLVADEPAAGLDPDAQLQVMELLRRSAGRGAAVVVSLHDLTLAVRCCDRLLVLVGGRTVDQGKPRETLTAATLREAFGLDGEVTDTVFGPVVAMRGGRGPDGP